MSEPGPILIVVLDGALAGALPPRLAALPHAATSLVASGGAVGLPEGKRADAETGYATLGAGRPVPPRALDIEAAAASRRLLLADELQILFRAVHNQSGPAPAVMPGVPTALVEEDRRSSLHVFTLLSDSAGRPSAAVRAALLGAASNDGVRLRVHALLDHGTTTKRAVAQLEQLTAELGDAGSVATISGRRHGFDGAGDVAGAWLLYQAAIRGPDAPTAEDWFDVIAQAVQDGTRLEDLAAHRLGDYAGARGSLFADFSSPSPTGPEWCWRSEDAALLVGSRSTDFADLARLLRRHGLAPDEARLLEERGRRVVAFEGPTLVSLVPIEAPERSEESDDEWIDSLVPRARPRATSLLADLAAARPVLAVAPRSRRHVIEYFGGGALPAGVERALVDTDREEPELSARALAAAVRAALDGGEHAAIVVCVPEIDRAAHLAEEEAVFRATRAVDEAFAPVVAQVLERGGVACVVSPFARGGESADAGCWFFGALELEPRGELADFAPTLAARVGRHPIAGATGRSLIRR